MGLNKYLVNLETSIPALKGACSPPLRRKSPLSPPSILPKVSRRPIFLTSDLPLLLMSNVIRGFPLSPKGTDFIPGAVPPPVYPFPPVPPE